MAQIKSGLASVTNGSAIVTGSSTIWQNNVSPGDAFTIAGTNVIYDVASIQSNTQLTLSAPYSGASATDVTYAITRDFTSPDNFPELVVGDIETPTILTRSIRKIQQRFNEASDYSDQSIIDHEALPDPHPQYLSGSANLSDVAAPATSFTNIKQNATTTSTGVIEKATTAEAEAGTADKYPDAAGVHASFNQYGLGGVIKSASSIGLPDFSALIDSGFYYLPNNRAGGGSFAITFKYTDTAGAFRLSNNPYSNTFYLHGTDSTDKTLFRDPVEIFHTGNVATTSENEEGTRNDVPVTPQGVHEAFNQYGLGSYSAEAPGLIAGITESGFYRTVVTTNDRPAGSAHAGNTVIHQQHSTGDASQIFIWGNNDRIHFRVIIGGVVGAWKEIFHTGNVATTAENEAGTRNDVPITPAGAHQAFNQYGLGKTSSLTSITDANTATRTGLYQGAGLDGVNFASNTRYGVLFVERRNLSQVFQTATSDLKQVYKRYSTDDGVTWSEWVQQYNQANILGTVSQSAGVPTGAIIESGSNANGSYTKYADGTLFCFVETGLTGDSADRYDMPYPVTFTGDPKRKFVSGSEDQGSSFTRFYNVNSVSSQSSTALSAYLGVNSIDYPIKYTVIGRWF